MNVGYKSDLVAASSSAFLSAMRSKASLRRFSIRNRLTAVVSGSSSLLLLPLVSGFSVVDVFD